MSIDAKMIVWFDEIGKEDAHFVGEKGAQLGEMISANLPVPYGFVITSLAHEIFIKESSLEKKINVLLQSANFDHPVSLQQISTHIRELIHKTPVPSHIAGGIMKYYEELEIRQNHFWHRDSVFQEAVTRVKTAYRPSVVAVRSSMVLEDSSPSLHSPVAVSFLNISGEAHIIEKVKECWAACYHEQVLFFRYKRGLHLNSLYMPVLVERMIASEKSGIAYTIDPVRNDKTKICIEALFGVSVPSTNEKITVDEYEVDKRSLVTIRKKIKRQSIKYVRGYPTMREVQLSAFEGKTQKLSEGEIEALSKIIKRIESLYFFPQYVQWAIEHNHIYIVGTKPLTALHHMEANSVSDALDLELAEKEHVFNHPIAYGIPMHTGMKAGVVYVYKTSSEHFLVEQGTICVLADISGVNRLELKKAGALVFEKVLSNSDGIQLAKELQIPIIVGVHDATEKLKSGMHVTVNGKSGEIYKGNILSSPLNTHSITYTKPKTPTSTLTKVMVNLSDPAEAKQIATLPVDGVGILKAEYMIAEMGMHPKQYIKEGRQDIFINLLSDKLLTCASAFHPRTLMYRASDFTTHEYRSLKKGLLFEPKEENPLIGFRGAARHIANPDVFGLELEALASVWKKGFHTIHLLIPYVRTTWELIRIKQIIGNYGFFSFPGFKLFITVEVPSCAIALQDFINIGIDGVCIDSEGLTELMLGVDKNNEDVSLLFDERNPAVFQLVQFIVKTCSEQKIYSCLSGQSLIDHPDYIHHLIRNGLTSVTVNPEAVARTRQTIHETEKKSFDSLKKLITSH